MNKIRACIAMTVLMSLLTANVLHTSAVYATGPESKETTVSLSDLETDSFRLLSVHLRLSRISEMAKLQDNCESGHTNVQSAWQKNEYVSKEILAVRQLDGFGLIGLPSVIRISSASEPLLPEAENAALSAPMERLLC